MSEVPVAKNFSDSLPEKNSTSDILRFDLCPDTKEAHDEKNTASVPDNTVNIYPTAELENITSDYLEKVDENKDDEIDVWEELKKLHDLRDKKLPIFTCDNVVLYFIEPNGDVKSEFEKNELIIFKLDGDPAEIFSLEVGNWIYPLFSIVKPFYKREEGIFVFPDIYSEVENAAVGLVIPKPNCDALYDILCHILDDKEASRTRRSTATDAPGSVIQNLNSGTSYIARNLISGATYLANTMDSATSSIMKKTQPQTTKSVNPVVRSLAHMSATATRHAASTTGYLSSSVGNAVTALGRYISPYVSKKLQETVPGAAVDVVLSFCLAANNIYNGLEESAEILTHSMSNNTVKLVEHRYGQPVGQVTSDVLSSVKNIYAAHRNASVWKPKSIAKGMLRSAGNAMLEDRRELKQTQSLQGLQGRTGPDPFNNS